MNGRGGKTDTNAIKAIRTDLIAEYQDAGHVTLRNLLPAERVRAIRPVVKDLVVAETREALPLEDRDTYHKAFLQVGDLNRKNPDLRQFAWDAGRPRSLRRSCKWRRCASTSTRH